MQDARYLGWEYVAARYRQVDDSLRGRIVYVLRGGGRPGTYELHDTQRPGPGYEVSLQDDVLRIHFPTRLETWVRRPLALPR